MIRILWIFLYNQRSLFDPKYKMALEKLQFQMAQHGLTHSQRKELMEKGPFNLVFHGLKADWIEEEMADDEEFKRDVLEQKIRTLIRDEVCRG